jgi:hypothetical protein
MFVLLCCATVLRATQQSVTISAGSAAGARAYYQSLSEELSFRAIPAETTLADLTVFAGYGDLGDKLESLDPAVLMDTSAASAEATHLDRLGLSGASLRDGDVLATRFFAPKIVNVNATVPNPGWRKMVRLRVRPGAKAAEQGVSTVVILFNFVQEPKSKPFSGRSFNTQAMLLAPSRDKRLYWLDFDTDGKLTLALNASFDAAALGKNQDYFVPDGCNGCHGSPGNLAVPMMNYLDTDHWFDRLDDDFKPLRDENTALIFDAGTNDTAAPSFRTAFDVIRRFNEEVLLQNVAVHKDSFETRAARKWLSLHAQSSEHTPVVARDISSGKSWSEAEAAELGLLNRYCFRCHGSVFFSVFDRPRVVDLAGAMQQHLKPSRVQAGIRGFRMPPDREIQSTDLDRLYAFLGALR